MISAFKKLLPWHKPQAQRAPRRAESELPAPFDSMVLYRDAKGLWIVEVSKTPGSPSKLSLHVSKTLVKAAAVARGSSGVLSPSAAS